jgi:2-dehydro-3-deoxyphosphogalactonate aldolase
MNGVMAILRGIAPGEVLQVGHALEACGVGARIR